MTSKSDAVVFHTCELINLLLSTYFYASVWRAKTMQVNYDNAHSGGPLGVGQIAVLDLHLYSRTSQVH